MQVYPIAGARIERLDDDSDLKVEPKADASRRAWLQLHASWKRRQDELRAVERSAA